METIVDLISAAGAIASLALLAWGMVLCLAHTFRDGRPANPGARWIATDLPAGTLS